jgi:hypothetical protein
MVTGRDQVVNYRDQGGRVVADRVVEPVPVGVLGQRGRDHRLRDHGGTTGKCRHDQRETENHAPAERTDQNPPCVT